MSISVTIFAIAAIAILATMMLALIRLFAGPTLYDRALAVNTFGTKTVLLIGVIGFLTERPEFLDIALIYALINFIGTIAILKFFRYRTLADPEQPAPAQPAPEQAAPEPAAPEPVKEGG